MDTQCFSSRVLPQASCAVEERASDMLLKGKRTSRARPTVQARSPALTTFTTDLRSDPLPTTPGSSGRTGGRELRSQLYAVDFALRLPAAGGAQDRRRAIWSPSDSGSAGHTAGPLGSRSAKARGGCDSGSSAGARTRGVDSGSAKLRTRLCSRRWRCMCSKWSMSRRRWRVRRVRHLTD